MRAEVIDKLSAFITAAFAFVAGLAWNTAIQQIFKNIFGEQSSVPAMLSYAVIVTLIAVIATISVGRAAEHAKSFSPRLPFRRQKHK